MNDIDWISEISNLATEIKDLREQREAVKAHKLLLHLYPKLDRFSTMFWRMQYYADEKGGIKYDEEANGKNPASRIHRCVDQAKGVVFHAILHGQLFNDIPDEIAKDAQGLFKHKD